MQTTTNDRIGPAVISQSDADVATQARANTRTRSVAFGVAALLSSFAVGTGVAALLRSRRAGLIAGTASAAAFATVRWQLQRWFTDEPAYIVERRIGKLELRRYAPRVEAHTRLAVLDFETALDEGFHRLAGYIFGENRAAQSLTMTTPVMSMPRARTHTVAFVMPPSWSLASLPSPRDERISLVRVPLRRIAALRFTGRYTGKNMLEHTRRLHELVAAADLDTRGQPIFACFDPPTTLPWLRRAEIWVELA